MGDGVIPPPIYPGYEEKTMTIGEYITELCAYYMAIGMPREVFLYGSRYAFDDYENAWECKQINENRMLHLQGLYNYRAFQSALSPAFAKNGSQGEPYLKYPIPITQTEKDAELERKKAATWAFVAGRKRG